MHWCSTWYVSYLSCGWTSYTSSLPTWTRVNLWCQTQFFFYIRLNRNRVTPHPPTHPPTHPHTHTPTHPHTHISYMHIASFPGLPTIQLLIAYGVQKRRENVVTCGNTSVYLDRQIRGGPPTKRAILRPFLVSSIHVLKSPAFVKWKICHSL